MYHLNGVKVCRAIFIQTLRISTSRVTTALRKTSASGSPNSLKDQRGKMTGGQLKLLPTTVKKVIEHIKSFPTYISHYCRKEKEAKFLPEEMTIEKMIILFTEKYPALKCSKSSDKNIFIQILIFVEKYLKRYL